MATKTFEELKQLAIQIRDEKTNKQNTATRIGTQMLEHLNKLEQDYYDKTATDKELKQRDAKLAELSSSINAIELYKNIDNNSRNSIIEYTENEGYFISKTLDIIPSEYSSCYTSPIKLNKGEAIYIQAYATDQISVISLSTIDGDLLESKIVGTNDEKSIYKYYSDTEESYVVLSYNTKRDHTIVKTSVNTDNIDSIKKFLFGDKIPIELNNGLINDGQINSELTNFRYSNPIRLSKGDRLRITYFGTSNVEFDVLSETDETGSFYKKLIKNDILNSTAVKKDKYFTVSEDMFVAACGYIGNKSSLHLEVNKIHNEYLLYSDIDSENTGSEGKVFGAPQGKEIRNDVNLLIGLYGKDNFTEIYPSFENNKYLSPDGNIVETVFNIQVSNEISLDKGDTIVFSKKGFNDTNLWLITSDKSVKLRDSKGVNVLKFTATKNCAVIISCVPDAEYHVYIVKSNKTGIKTFGIDFREHDDTFFDYDTQTFKAGNDVWFSKSIDVRDTESIDYEIQTPIATVSKVAFANFFDSEDNYISHDIEFTAESKKIKGTIYPPKNAVKCIIQTTNSYSIANTYIKVNARFNYSDNIPNFDTLIDLAESKLTGVMSVGCTLFKSITGTPLIYDIKKEGNTSKCYDINKIYSQYKVMNNSKTITDEVFKYAGKEISFIPNNDNYSRIIIGKDNEDIFYVAYLPSKRKNSPGTKQKARLETTKDFETFVTLWEDARESTPDALRIDNIIDITPEMIRVMSDNSLIIGATFTDNSLPATDDLGNSNYNNYLGYFRISSDRKSIKQCTGIDIDGSQSKVIGSHGISGTSYVTNNVYDWSMSSYGSKIVVTEYGSRNPADDWGRVWYSENNGINWVEIFQTRKHLNDNKNENATKAHTHGVMYDYYSGYIFVITGEDKSTIYYTKKGINTKDGDWEYIKHAYLNENPNLAIRNQCVIGFPFENCILFGADMNGFGGLLRINRLSDGSFSPVEIAHDVLPFVVPGTTYCTGGSFRRDRNSPYLICITRENQANSEEENETLMQQHLGRVIATYDGYSFAEIWKDNTYGNHDVIVNGIATKKNFCYCTRDMTAYHLNNGDILIKYAGREHVYLGGRDYLSGIADFSNKALLIKNADKYL